MATTLHILGIVLTLVVALHAVRGQPVAPIDPPVSPNALPEVSTLLQYMRSIQGRYILSGQQEFPSWPWNDADTDDIEYIQNLTGRTVAVRGFDLMFYTHSDGGRASQAVAERAIEWARDGGIVTLCVHFFMDAGSAGPGSGPAFYRQSAAGSGRYTTVTMADALTPGSAANTEFVADLDILANELKKLRDAHIPVIWRPFHECSGNWFWWSGTGSNADATQFIAAWQFMFDRFTNMHGLNNLIWVYNPNSIGALPTWYPGDAYVDMISIDVYPGAGHPVHAAESTAFHDFKSGRKLIAISENGRLPDPDQLFAQNTMWTYFCTWNGEFIQSQTYQTDAFKQTMFDHPRVITRDELAPFYTAPGTAPTIVVHPKNATAAAGANLTLTVAARGSEPLSYQWKQAGTDISGATDATLALDSISFGDAGTYSVAVTNPEGTVTSNPASVTVPAGPYTPPTVTLANLSTRGEVGAGNDVMIAGLAIGGNGAKRVLIRAVGPGLVPLGIPADDVVPDPVLTITTPSGVLLTANDDWNIAGTPAALESAFAATGAFTLDHASRDAAIIVDLAPGNYTAIVSGAVLATGVALVEVYDLDLESPSRLLNLSTRARVGVGNSVLIGGYVVSGVGGMNLLIRAAGPALAGLGLQAPSLLADPRIDIVGAGNAPVGANDDWEDDGHGPVIEAARLAVGAFSFAAGGTDAAVLGMQSPGPKTAIISGRTGQSGTTLVELYVVP